MTRAQFWGWVRYEMLVLGVAALVLGACAANLQGAVHIGQGSEFDAPYMHLYRGELTAWALGQSTVGGWVENHDIVNCPNVRVWIDVGAIHGGLQVTMAIPGQLKPSERATWTGTLLDERDHPLRVTAKPKPVSFACVWPPTGSR